MEQGLDEIGIIEGSDRSSLGRDCLRHYEALFADWRHEPITLLEIGGSALGLWSRYFDRAAIVGIDINENRASERCEIEVGSRDDLALLHDVGRRRLPHIIIDGGVGTDSFRTLFFWLRPGGIYIVESLSPETQKSFARLVTRPSTDIASVQFFSGGAAIIKG